MPLQMPPEAIAHSKKSIEAILKQPRMSLAEFAAQSQGKHSYSKPTAQPQEKPNHKS